MSPRASQISKCLFQITSAFIVFVFVQWAQTHGFKTEYISLRGLFNRSTHHNKNTYEDLVLVIDVLNYLNIRVKFDHIAGPKNKRNSNEALFFLCFRKK